MKFYLSTFFDSRKAILDEIKDEWEIVTNPDVSVHDLPSLKVY